MTIDPVSALLGFGAASALAAIVTGQFRQAVAKEPTDLLDAPAIVTAGAGDVLIFKSVRPLKPEQHESVRSLLKQVFGEQRCLVLEGDISLEAVVAIPSTASTDRGDALLAHLERCQAASARMLDEIRRTDADGAVELPARANPRPDLGEWRDGKWG